LKMRIQPLRCEESTTPCERGGMFRSDSSGRTFRNPFSCGVRNPSPWSGHAERITRSTLGQNYQRLVGQCANSNSSYTTRRLRPARHGKHGEKILDSRGGYWPDIVARQSSSFTRLWSLGEQILSRAQCSRTRAGIPRPTRAGCIGIGTRDTAHHTSLRTRCG